MRVFLSYWLLDPGGIFAVFGYMYIKKREVGYMEDFLKCLPPESKISDINEIPGSMKCLQETPNVNGKISVLSGPNTLQKLLEMDLI